MKLREAMNKAWSDSEFSQGDKWANYFLASLELSGFFVVPKEATEEMRNAAYRREDRSGDAFKSVYRAMLAARPTIEE